MVSLINAGLTAAGSNATVTLTGGALTINGDTTQTISFSDGLNGIIAADLGIATTVRALTSQSGARLAAHLHHAAGGRYETAAGIDPSGIQITNANSATITSSARCP